MLLSQIEKHQSNACRINLAEQRDGEGALLLFFWQNKVFERLEHRSYRFIRAVRREHYQACFVRGFINDEERYSARGEQCLQPTDGLERFCSEAERFGLQDGDGITEDVWVIREISSEITADEEFDQSGDKQRIVCHLLVRIGEESEITDCEHTTVRTAHHHGMVAAGVGPRREGIVVPNNQGNSSVGCDRACTVKCRSREAFGERIFGKGMEEHITEVPFVLK